MTWADRKTWTPGPWTLEGGLSGTRDADGELHPLVTGPNRENPVCLFDGNWNSEWDDARLVAAAPDLYDALVLAFDELRKWYESDFDAVRGRTEVMMPIREALAKATGV